MASLESKLFYALLRLINKKKFLEMQFAFGKFDFYNSTEPPRKIHKVCRVTSRQVHGRAVFTLAPKLRHASGIHILYLHGGAYIQNFVRQHWLFLSFLVEQTQCTITAPDYPLAPAHTYADAFAMVEPLYEAWVQAAGMGRTLLMGDSAGGGFALALAQCVKHNGMRQPSKIILLSPWLDITLTNPDIEKIDPLDPFLSVQGLRKAGLAYAGNASPVDFRLSPLYGSLNGVAEISIFIGSKDILAADARKLAAMATEQGITVNYREYKDMVHVWMLLNFRESKQARIEIVQLITGQ
jgi:epsilon-lactone hydrolase